MSDLEHAEDIALRIISKFYDAINDDNSLLSGIYDSAYEGHALGMYVFDGAAPWWSSLSGYAGYHFSKETAGLLAGEGKPWNKGYIFSGDDVGGFQHGALALVIRHPAVSQEYFDSTLLPYYTKVMHEIQAPIIMNISINNMKATTFLLDPNGIHYFPASADPEF